MILAMSWLETQIGFPTGQVYGTNSFGELTEENQVLLTILLLIIFYQIHQQANQFS
jgi:hypothetical protein